MKRCLACGHDEWVPLPDPHPQHAIVSDLRIVDSPLGKVACRSCALVRAESLADSQLYHSGYALYDHAPGAARESARQAAYAEWIAEHVVQPPARILDVGCGNGSLLAALHQRWPRAVLCGIDPAPEAIGHARAAGIDAQCGVLADWQGEPVDLAVAVNVLEHVPSPLAFLDDVARVLEPGGRLIVVCPDGGTPSVELLFADHLWSFSAAQLSALMARTPALLPADGSNAPDAIGAFHMASAFRDSGSVVRPDHVVATSVAPDVLIDAKRSYLQRWELLDGQLFDRTGATSDGSLMCFGIGEAAGLLRAYAPRTWSRVAQCVADAPERSGFGDLPVSDLSDCPPSTMLLGVKPAAQPLLASRLTALGHSVVRWDDIIHA